MPFSEYMIEELSDWLSSELSQKRYEHTLGVVRAALSLSEFFSEISKSEISAAALLHDVAKELSPDEQIRLARAYLGESLDAELSSPQVIHALAAPARILERHPQFATPAVLSAVLKHTTGSEDMSVFDKIIFLADYIEDGRTYNGCVLLREKLFRELNSAKTMKEREDALNRACLYEIDETVASLARRGLTVDSKTLRARNAISSLI